MLKFIIEDDGKAFDNVDELLDWCIESDYHEDDDYFEEWVNEMYTGVEIAGTYYSAYDILNNADDGNLHDLLNDFCESMNDNDRENAECELRHASNGEKIYIQNYTVLVTEDEDCDGDEDVKVDIEELRKTVASYNASISEEEEKNEYDIMSLFQRIGG